MMQKKFFSDTELTVIMEDHIVGLGIPQTSLYACSIIRQIS